LSNFTDIGLNSTIISCRGLLTFLIGLSQKGSLSRKEKKAIVILIDKLTPSKKKRKKIYLLPFLCYFYTFSHPGMYYTYIIVYSKRISRIRKTFQNTI
jgi:predicted AlkP superfamily pyrophosphatase or phosphodiesterase